MATTQQRYVIERTSESKREWWTGSGWSEDDHRAQWFECKPDACREADDENAHVVEYTSGTVS